MLSLASCSAVWVSSTPGQAQRCESVEYGSERVTDSLHLLYYAAEANYAHQQELDMIPLMMQKDYSPKGWREYTALDFAEPPVFMPLTCGNDDDRSGSDFGHPHVVRNVGR